MVKIDLTHGWYTVDENNKYNSYNDQPAISVSSHLEIGENDESFDVEGFDAWYKHGELHRDNDLPAMIKNNGNKYWYINGIFIRYELNKNNK